MNVLSLFDGMSCGRVALERADIPVTNYFASEIDKHAIKVSEHNYPDIIRLGDVTKVSYKDGVLYSEKGEWNVGKIDLLLAGSPCQGFSIAGKQLAFEDERSKLYFEFERILKEVNPTYFLLENVKMKQEYKNIITERLGVNPIAINSNLVSAQNRYRLYWTNIGGVEQPEDKGIYLQDILCSSVEREALISDIQLSSSSNRLRRCYASTKAPTLLAAQGKKATDSIRICVDNVERYPTRNEMEQMQTVPIGYTKAVTYNQAASCLGNGWTVDVISHILNNIERN